MPFEKVGTGNGSDRSLIKFKIIYRRCKIEPTSVECLSLAKDFRGKPKKLAVTIVDIGKLLSSSDNFVVAVFFNIV